jgi:hypothetical protein
VIFMRKKRGQSTGGGAAALVGIIAALIVLYIIFLEPADREKRLDDASEDRIRLQSVDDSAWTELTVQAWINPDDTGDDRIFGKCWGTATTDQTWLLRTPAGNNFGCRHRTNSANEAGYDPATHSVGSWQMAAYTWVAGSPGVLRVYDNGVEAGSGQNINGTLLYQFPVTNNPTIGNVPGGGRGYDGQIQEVRVLKAARSGDWLSTEYANQNNPTSFITKGSEEVYPTTECSSSSSSSSSSFSGFSSSSSSSSESSSSTSSSSSAFCTLAKLIAQDTNGTFNCNVTSWTDVPFNNLVLEEDSGVIEQTSNTLFF